MAFQKGTRMFEVLPLLMLGFIILGNVGAWKITKRRASSQKGNNCPSLESNSIKVDIRIINHQQGIRFAHTFQNRSTSPWDYNITNDPNRFPSEIAEARCRYSGCISAEGQEENGKNSVPIQQEVLVLRREPAQSCSHSFRLEKILMKKQTQSGCDMSKDTQVTHRSISRSLKVKASHDLTSGDNRKNHVTIPTTAFTLL